MAGSQKQGPDMFDREQFIEQCLEQSKQLDIHLPWMSELRAQSREQMHNQGLPAINSEYWKYSSLDKFLVQSSAQAKKQVASHIADDELNTSHWGSKKALNLNMLGGQATRHTAITIPKGLTIARFSEATGDASALLNRHFNKNIETLSQQQRYLYTNFNTGMLSDGLLVHVSKGVSVEPLLNILIQPNGYQRLLVILEPGSHLHLLEQVCSSNKSGDRLNGITECTLSADSHLVHSRVQGHSKAGEYSMTSSKLERNAEYNYNFYTLGAQNRRHDINIMLSGDHSQANLNAAQYAHESDHLDTQVNMQHIGQHTKSQQKIRAIARGKARLSINGRIHIHPHAQHSDATLSNKNLLIDNSARINTKPELEIYADQVKCAHGATIGQIDAEEIFYLRSRGINLSQARHMIARGFIQSCLTESTFSAYVENMFQEAFSAWKL